MSEEEKKLEEELQIAYDEDQKRFDSAPPDMDFRQFQEYMSVTSKKVSEISRKLRLIKEPTFSEIPDFGDVMSLDQFISMVNEGWFIDYDGSGNYVKDNQMSNIDIYPSDVHHDVIRKDFDTIIWFNR